MRPARVSFAQGDPLPAANVNSLVGSTAEVAAAATHEHSPDGLHLHLRFEIAMGVALLSGGTWTTEFGDRIHFGAGSSGILPCFFDQSDAHVVSRFTTLGAIAYNQDGIEVPHITPSPGANPDELQINFYPPSGSTMVFVTLLARRNA